MTFAFFTDTSKKAELLPKLKSTLTELEGVERVIDGNEGPSLGVAIPEQNAGMGALILFAKKGYAFQFPANSEKEVSDAANYLGTHGYPASDPELDGILIASGYGIQKGVRVERASNFDVAPTLSRLLRVQLPDQEGRLLEEFLLEQP